MRLGRNALACLWLALAGCGYTAKSRLPEDVKTVAVPIFRNQTFYRDLELELAQALRKEVLAKTNARVSSVKNADAILEGEIIDFRLVKLRESLRDEVVEYSVRLTVDVSFKDLKTDENIVSIKELKRRAEFEVNRGQGIKQARQEAVKELAREIVSRTLNRW